MSMRDVLLFAVVAVGVGLAGASPAAAQTFPDHVIKIVVPYPPGGPSRLAGVKENPVSPGGPGPARFL